MAESHWQQTRYPARSSQKEFCLWPSCAGLRCGKGAQEVSQQIDSNLPTVLHRRADIFDWCDLTSQSELSLGDGLLRKRSTEQYLFGPAQAQWRRSHSTNAHVHCFDTIQAEFADTRDTDLGDCLGLPRAGLLCVAKPPCKPLR